MKVTFLKLHSTWLNIIARLLSLSIKTITAQSLDRAVYGPFVKYYNTAANDCLRSHTNGSIYIHYKAQIVCKTIPLAHCNTNVIKGFEVSSIAPMNKNFFPHNKFINTYVTDSSYIENIMYPFKRKKNQTLLLTNNRTKLRIF